VVGRRNPTNQVGRLADRYAALAAGRAKPATGFVSQPEPRSIGLYARGKQLTAGNILLAGTLIEAPGASLWDLAPDPAFVAEAQGFGWLDDLAAYGTPQAVRLAQDWTWDWIARHGTGTGPGWTPDLTGRRIIRWIHNALFSLERATASRPRLSTARSPGNRSTSRAAGRPPPPALRASRR
jgi:uncharacterized heparinase superfamily protein